MECILNNIALVSCVVTVLNSAMKKNALIVRRYRLKYLRIKYLDVGYKYMYISILVGGYKHTI